MNSFVNDSLLTWVCWMQLGGSRWVSPAARWPPRGRWCRKGNVCWCISWCLKMKKLWKHRENTLSTLNLPEALMNSPKRWRAAARGLDIFYLGTKPIKFHFGVCRTQNKLKLNTSVPSNAFIRTPFSANVCLLSANHIQCSFSRWWFRIGTLFLQWR